MKMNSKEGLFYCIMILIVSTKGVDKTVLSVGLCAWDSRFSISGTTILHREESYHTYTCMYI